MTGSVTVQAMHILDADTCQIVASTLTTNDMDEGPKVGPLFDQMAGPIASFTSDGAYDSIDVSTRMTERHLERAILPGGGLVQHRIRHGTDQVGGNLDAMEIA